MASNSILFTGTAHDFGGLEISFNGQVVLVQARSIDYSDGLEGEDVYVASAQRYAQTRGNYKAEGSISLTKRGQQQLHELLGEGFYDARFLIAVKYLDTDGGGIIVDTLKGCRLLRTENAHANGAAALEGTSPLDIGMILWNGVAPIQGAVL